MLLVDRRHRRCLVLVVDMRLEELWRHHADVGVEARRQQQHRNANEGVDQVARQQIAGDVLVENCPEARVVHELPGQSDRDADVEHGAAAGQLVLAADGLDGVLVVDAGDGQIRARDDHEDLAHEEVRQLAQDGAVRVFLEQVERAVPDERLPQQAGHASREENGLLVPPVSQPFAHSNRLVSQMMYFTAIDDVGWEDSCHAVEGVRRQQDDNTDNEIHCIAEQALFEETLFCIVQADPDEHHAQQREQRAHKVPQKLDPGCAPPAQPPLPPGRDDSLARIERAVHGSIGVVCVGEDDERQTHKDIPHNRERRVVEDRPFALLGIRPVRVEEIPDAHPHDDSPMDGDDGLDVELCVVQCGMEICSWLTGEEFLHSLLLLLANEQASALRRLCCLGHIIEQVFLVLEFNVFHLRALNGRR
eukprot:m.43887 g.43887  ORF g.43887 m.43887 type:complete len:419 (-) comp5800_c0_seq1:5-1261(-)